MPVELSQLMQLVSRQRTSLQVGDLPRIVATYLQCHPAIVYLGHEEILKIVHKHPEIRVEELQCLPFAISKGEYREDRQRGARFEPPPSPGRAAPQRGGNGKTSLNDERRSALSAGILSR